RLAAFVQPLIGYYGPATDFIKVNPVPYPPIFVLLVMPFSLFQPVVGFVLWTAANAAASAYVVTRLARRVVLPAWLVVPTALLWLPLGLGLFVGQPVGL